MSHPSRVRGLKYHTNDNLACGALVAPFTGAWIEIKRFFLSTPFIFVAPFTGAWIEISDYVPCHTR